MDKKSVSVSSKRSVRVQAYLDGHRAGHLDRLSGSSNDYSRHVGGPYSLGYRHGNNGLPTTTWIYY